MPVPMTAPMPSKVSWKAPSERLSDFFSAVARISSSDLIRPRPPSRGAAVAMTLPSNVKFVGATLTAAPREGNPFRQTLAREHRPERPAAEDVDM